MSGGAGPGSVGQRRCSLCRPGKCQGETGDPPDHRLGRLPVGYAGKSVPGQGNSSSQGVEAWEGLGCVVQRPWHLGGDSGCWKVGVSAAQSCPTLCDPMDCMKPTRLLCPWASPGKAFWSGWPFPSPGDLLDPGSKLRSPALQADSLPSEPPGKPWVVEDT